jgi:hypothetical protein
MLSSLMLIAAFILTKTAILRPHILLEIILQSKNTRIQS